MIRRLGIGLAVVLASLVLIVLVLFGVAQTSYGQRMIAGALESALSGPDGAAEVRGLEGFLPFRIRLDRLALADEAGVWLSVDDARLIWRPSALLEGRLEVERVGAGRVELARLPEGEPAPEPDPDGDEPFRLPELPDLLPLITVDRLAVEELVLGQPILGEAVTFDLEGYAATMGGGEAVEMALDLQRTDRRTANLSLDATLALDPLALNLDLEARDRGRLVERLAGLQESGDFTARLVGNGPLRGWRGDLSAGGAGLGQLQATLTLALLDQPRLGLEAVLDPSAALVPADLAAILGDQIRVDLQATQTAAQAIDLAQLEIASGPLAATVAGTFDFDAQALDAEASLAIERLQALSDLAGAPLAGSVEARLRAHGDFLQPKGRLELEGSRLVLADVQSRAVALGLDFTALAPLDEAPAASLTLTGRLQELVVTPQLPPRDVTIALDAERPPDTPARIERLEIADGNAALGVTGRLSPDHLEGELQVTLSVDRLEPLTAPFGQPVEGALGLDGTVTIAPGAERIAAAIDGGLRELGGLPPGAAEVLGRHVQVALEAAFSRGEGIIVDRLSLDGEQLAVGGEGRIGLDSGALAAQVAMTLQDLQTLTPVAGTPLEGDLRANAVVSGTLTEPRVEVAVSGEELVVADRPLQRLQLDLSVDGLDPLAGRVDLVAALPRFEASAGAAYRLARQELAIEDLQVEAPGIALTGQLQADLAQPLITGRVEGRAADLAELAPLVPVPLRGEARFELVLEEGEAGGQVARLDAGASEVSGPFGALAQAALEASARDLFATPTMDGALTVQDFRQGETRVDRLELAVAGTPEQLDVTLETAGTANVDFDLQGAADVQLAEALRVTLEELTGTVAEQPVDLQGPATLVRNGQQLEVQDLALSYGPARLQADLALGPGPVSGEIELARLPLGALEPFGAPPLAGTAEASLSLEGQATAPRAELSLQVQDLRSPDPQYGEVPPIDLELTSTLAGGRLETTLDATGLTDQPVTGRVALPVNVDLATYAFEVPPSGVLEGGLEAELQLRRIVDLLALEGQRLQGLLTLDVELGGTVADPAPQGRIELADGRYDNGELGTVLRQIRLIADIDEERLAIEELSATDGGSGRVTGSGTVGLSAAEAWPMDLELQISRATLVRREDLRATLGGSLTFEGDLDEALLAGQITVERAEIGIPEGGGPDVATLDVQEVGGAAGVPEEVEEAGEDPGMVILLDVTIRVPGQVYVRGRGLESEWEGRMQVTGTADDPELVGDLSVRRGHFDFIDKRFQLREGTISFAGALPSTPLIMVEAAAETEEITAIVRAEGTPEDLQISLSSEPELPEDEVLSQLLFDRDVSEISAIEAASLAMAVNRLRGGGGGLDILGRARKALGVDTLDVGGAPGEEAVRAGKYLGDDVYVELEQGRAEDSGRARVELEILPNVSVEAETGQDASSGVGVKWKYDF